MQNLNQFLATYESYLSQNAMSGHPNELYEPANYILSLGGKRLRPALLLAGHYLFRDDYETALPAAHAIEVFHNFTLVHDDIMDAAPLRRGNATVHVKFGTNAGILSGDAMLVSAYKSLLNTSTPRLLEIAQLFNETALGVCEGQQLDMNFETQAQVSIDEYLKMIEQKTAILVAASIKMGALIGGATLDDAAQAYEFGKNLGIAFQLKDDILDAFGDPKKFGKKPGGDIVQNKKTFLYLKALELAPNAISTRLKELYSQPSTSEAEKVSEVLNIFQQLNVKAIAEEIKEAYWDTSQLALAKIAAPNSRKGILKDFARTLMVREF